MTIEAIISGLKIRNYTIEEIILTSKDETWQISRKMEKPEEELKVSIKEIRIS